mgnify:CR=1 FL=1
MTDWNEINKDAIWKGPESIVDVSKRREREKQNELLELLNDVKTLHDQMKKVEMKYRAVVGESSAILLDANGSMMTEKLVKAVERRFWGEK